MTPENPFDLLRNLEGLFLLGSRPGCGKTTLVTQLAQILDGVIVPMATDCLREAPTGIFDSRDRMWRDRGIEVYDMREATRREFKSELSRCIDGKKCSGEKPSAIVIDDIDRYLMRTSRAGSKSAFWFSIPGVLRDLRSLMEQKGVKTAVCTMGLGRKVEERRDRRPTVDDFRGCRVVKNAMEEIGGAGYILLYRPDFYEAIHRRKHNVPLFVEVNQKDRKQVLKLIFNIDQRKLRSPRTLQRGNLYKR